LNQLLDAPQRVALLRGAGDIALPLAPARAVRPDSMHVAVRIDRQVEVDDV
jgi:hypothetical protein